MFEKGHKPPPCKKRKVAAMTSFQKLVEKKYGIDRDEQITRRLEQIPIKYRGTYKKAIARRSMRAAVNSQCLECVGHQRREVSFCTDLGCPLYLYRPYQKRTNKDDMPSDAGPDAD